MSSSDQAAAAPWQTLVDALAQRLFSTGIDIVAPLAVGHYNDRVRPELRLPDLGDPRSLAILCGSTHAMWPRFIAAWRRDPALAQSPHPVDAYVERAVEDAVRALPGTAPCAIRYAHEPPPRRVAIQRLAEIAGLAALSPSHLCVHPTYGPWFGLRAVIVLPVPQDPIDPQTLPTVRREPCASCARPCMPALETAVAAGGATHDGLVQNWQLWLAVRDACPIGKAHRYDDAAIRYFYSRDRRALTDDS